MLEKKSVRLCMIMRTNNHEACPQVRTQCWKLWCMLKYVKSSEQRMEDWFLCSLQERSHPTVDSRPQTTAPVCAQSYRGKQTYLGRRNLCSRRLLSYPKTMWHIEYFIRFRAELWSPFSSESEYGIIRCQKQASVCCEQTSICLKTHTTKAGFWTYNVAGRSFS